MDAVVEGVEVVEEQSTLVIMEHQKDHLEQG